MQYATCFFTSLCILSLRLPSLSFRLLFLLSAHLFPFIVLSFILLPPVFVPCPVYLDLVAHELIAPCNET